MKREGKKPWNANWGNSGVATSPQHYATTPEQVRAAVAVFTPVALVPEQTRRSPVQKPEKALCQAILKDALDTFRKYTGKTGLKARRLRHEALHWILDDSEEALAWPFSFVNICQYLDLEADAVREWLTKGQEEEQPATRPSSHRPSDPTSRRSRFIGVSRNRHGSKWVARIGSGLNRTLLGSFPSEEEAARAYDLAALRHYGRSTLLNFPEQAEVAA